MRTKGGREGRGNERNNEGKRRKKGKKRRRNQKEKKRKRKESKGTRKEKNKTQEKKTLRGLQYAPLITRDPDSASFSSLPSALTPLKNWKLRKVEIRVLNSFCPSYSLLLLDLSLSTFSQCSSNHTNSKVLDAALILTGGEGRMMGGRRRRPAWVHTCTVQSTHPH